MWDADIWPDARGYVDDLYIELSLGVSDSFTPVFWYNGDHGSRIRLSFRVQCNANFYGSNCATECVPTDGSSGHYTCADDGEKICRSGWSDPSQNCLVGRFFRLLT